MARSGDDHVLLDVTALPRRWLRERFPLIAKTCRVYGVDIATTPIPVAPAAHFMIGGVKTNVYGATSLPGLYAVGETACAGVHGANRLASNSLLEGLVFGSRTGGSAAAGARLAGQRRVVPPDSRDPRAPADVAALQAVRATIRRLMWEGVGIERTASSIRRTLDGLAREGWLSRVAFGSREGIEAQNLLLVATVVAKAALARRGSVGCHFRRDCPKKGSGWRRHTTVVSGSSRRRLSRRSG
jgi:L-aspartate oxidase